LDEPKFMTGSPPSLRQLLTLGYANKGGTDPVSVLRPLRFQIWRSKNSGATWESKPDSIGVEILPDCCGIRFSANARNPKDPWTWNGNTGAPVVYDLMVTLAIETTEPIDSTIDLTVASSRVREYFMDGGNAYTAVKRVNAVININSDSNPTALAPDTTKTNTKGPNGTKTFGTKGTPDVFYDESDAMAADLRCRLHMKNAACIQGSLLLTGLRIDPWPIGCLVGTLTVAGDEPIRQTMNLNACIRSFKMERSADTIQTTYTLDGR
jgi:hypothetical protein